MTKCIYDLQFGFRAKHSTDRALISLTEMVREALDSGKFSCGIFVDLQKAFDTVDHEILLTKLDYYGIRGLACVMAVVRIFKRDIYGLNQSFISYFLAMVHIFSHIMEKCVGQTAQFHLWMLRQCMYKIQNILSLPFILKLVVFIDLVLISFYQGGQGKGY